MLLVPFKKVLMML